MMMTDEDMGEDDDHHGHNQFFNDKVINIVLKLSVKGPGVIAAPIIQSC